MIKRFCRTLYENYKGDQYYCTREKGHEGDHLADGDKHDEKSILRLNDIIDKYLLKIFYMYGSRKKAIEHIRNRLNMSKYLEEREKNL